ncbi:HEAT repeat domain-containing protein [Streptomyces peucetius]|uniref:HEAT repeat domain-containing protein n=1 Tax=Streptomyces peucetius TaxID=1950 RepID=A0ABY6ICC5_STRPE|nr:HEAT repeat domain-containing protein [Streptomyces peucetius]UYQ64374.1 HEAT repeat domain-containing protein [Streptomyces peucetius]
MFAGIDEVEWASLEHAYGPADDVPELLRGLASADPAERENALDGMYGAVHHQGDVYDSTLACIPFLMELVADPDVRDRGCVVELLTSIGGIDLDGDELDPEDEEFEDAANYAMAASAVTAGADVFLGLLDDPDRGVRLAAPHALATLHSDPVRVLRLLRGRLEAEQDTEVRLACVEAAGRIALRHESLLPEVVDLLTTLSRAAYGAGVRLAALAQLARCAPGALPSDVVPGVTGLLRELRTQPVASAPAAEGLPSATLLGQLRQVRSADTAPHRAPWTADLLRTLHDGLGDRVDDRTALLADQLCSPDRAQRVEAVRMSSSLLRTWRGAYGELVGLLGEQLADPEPRLAMGAAYALKELFGLALPAADALAQRVAAEPSTWVLRWENGPPTLCPAIVALARAGDARVVPVLAEILDRAEAPGDLGHSLDELGRAAAPLAPALRERLAGLALDDRLADRVGPLLHGLSVLGPGAAAAESVPAVLRVLRGATGERREGVVRSAVRTLTAFGPAAREAVPHLWGLLREAGYGQGADPAAYLSPAGAALPPALAARTAGALWAIEGDRDAVLPVLCAVLNTPEQAGRQSAASVLGTMGTAGAAAAPQLARLLRSMEPWTRVRAAVALWRVSEDPEQAWPVLRAAWETMPRTRMSAAACLADLSTAGAEGAERLVDRELLSARRHNGNDNVADSRDIVEDERLLALCRQAVHRGP